MEQQADQRFRTIIKAIHDLQEQIMRVQRFSTEELQNLRDLYDSLESVRPSANHNRDIAERGPVQDNHVSPPPFSPGSPPPPAPNTGAPSGTANTCSDVGETGPESVEAGLGLGPGLPTRNVSDTRDIIPLPPPPVASSNAPTSERIATASAPSPSSAALTFGQSGSNVPTRPTQVDCRRDGNLLINQRACCPHCSRAVFIQVSSTMQPGDTASGSGLSTSTSSSSSTEAVLRFRVHVLTVAEILAMMSASGGGSTLSSAAAHGFIASTPTNPNTNHFTFPPCTAGQ